MLKKFLLAMGLVLTALIGGCLFLVGGVGLSAAEEAPRNKSVAVALTRDLARSWDVTDLKPHFVSAALGQIDLGRAQQSFEQLRGLGALESVRDMQQTSFYINTSFRGETIKTATVVLLAEFENGRARVIVQLASEGGEMKLMHVDVTQMSDILPKKQRA